MVKDCLAVAHPDLQIVLVPIKTEGDMITDRPLAFFGGKGLFVKQIEEALLAGRVDMAVHSMKDVPTDIPPGLTFATIPAREDPRDVLVSLEGTELEDLPQGALVGTSSIRRRAQLLNLRPDLSINELRGNLDTRIKKLKQGQFDAIILAAAGLNRMGWQDIPRRWLAPEKFIPAPGQGALGLEVKADDDWASRLTAALNCPQTYREVTAERAFARGLGGGCQVPVAAYAQEKPELLTLTGLVISLDGKRVVRDQISGPADQGEGLGQTLAENVLHQGGDEILKEFS
jgi:hydroxymethylbilane synthase